MGRGLDGFLIPVLVGCVVLRVCEARSRTISGGFGVGETPLPIPNRAVKPHSADGTWPSRAWESRSPPVLQLTGRPSGGSSSLTAATDEIGAVARSTSRDRYRREGN